MRVAVFRASEDADRTAARLETLGHEAVLAPVTRIVSTGATVPVGTADALIFSSAHAPISLASHAAGVESLRDLTCWCVGSRTAAAAASVGFRRITACGGDAARLAAAIVAHGATERLTFVTGRDRKPDLEEALARARCALTVVESYHAEAMTRWSDDLVARLGTADAALHYSRRSATLAVSLASTARISGTFRRWTHCCLSQDVATGLDRDATPDVRLAHTPDEDALLALLVTRK